jgi:GNAT superfamily N-acetyltransferase
MEVECFSQKIGLRTQERMFIQRIEEYKIPGAVHCQIGALLEASFSGYPKGRTYYKQLPDFRYLVWESEQLIGHMAVDHRLMSVDGVPFKIFGVVDLCIADSYQRNKLATRLLEALEELGSQCNIDFIMLMAQHHPFYDSNGFQSVDNQCKWLLIQEHKSLGVIHRKMKQALMVKPLQDKAWPEGLVDFMGHVF